MASVCMTHEHGAAQREQVCILGLHSVCTLRLHMELISKGAHVALQEEAGRTEDLWLLMLPSDTRSCGTSCGSGKHGALAVT